MRTPEQAKWDFVEQWLEKAKDDLRGAEILLEGKAETYDLVGFHAQQAAEKFIKAYLVRHQFEFPKTHNIAHLVAMVAKADDQLAKQLLSAEALTIYGVEYRYPGDFEPLSQAQAKEALSLAVHTRDTVLASLKSYLEAGPSAKARRGGEATP